MRRERKQESVRIGPVVRQSLGEIRKLLGRTQVQVSRVSLISQGDVSVFEGQTDYRRSTLERYVKGLGGKLRLFVEVDGEAWEIE